MREELIRKLFELQDTTYRDFHSGLCPGTVNIIGVRIPMLRKIAKELIKQDYRQFLAEMRNEYYEETMIEGFVIATAKISLTERLRLLKDFVPKIDNWAVCDSVCASFKFQQEDLPQVWRLVTRYVSSRKEFELRFMLITMLDHFLQPEYISEVLKIAQSIESGQYYVRMAQAWLIAECFIKAREQTLALLKHNTLTPWVQNKAIQKIRESYRVTPEDKQMLLQYKK